MPSDHYAADGGGGGGLMEAIMFNDALSSR